MGRQGGGKLTPLQTTGCRLAHVSLGHRVQGGGKLRPYKPRGVALPEWAWGTGSRAEASSRPYQPRGVALPEWAWGYAMFYVSTQSFDDRDKPPAVSRGGACLRPVAGVWPYSEN